MKKANKRKLQYKRNSRSRNNDPTTMYQKKRSSYSQIKRLSNIQPSKVSVHPKPLKEKHKVDDNTKFYSTIFPQNDSVLQKESALKSFHEVFDVKLEEFELSLVKNDVQKFKSAFLCLRKITNKKEIPLKFNRNGTLPLSDNKMSSVTYLQFAAWNGYAEIVQELLEHEADPNYRLKDKGMGFSALHFAVLSGRKDIIKLLIQHKADTFMKSFGPFFVDPVQMSFYLGVTDVLEFIVEEVDYLNLIFENQDLKKSLGEAFFNDYVHQGCNVSYIVRELIKKDYYFNILQTARDEQGRSLFDLCVLCGDSQGMRYLFSKGIYSANWNSVFYLAAFTPKGLPKKLSYFTYISVLDLVLKYFDINVNERADFVHEATGNNVLHCLSLLKWDYNEDEITQEHVAEIADILFEHRICFIDNTEDLSKDEVAKFHRIFKIHNANIPLEIGDGGSVSTGKSSELTQWFVFSFLANFLVQRFSLTEKMMDENLAGNNILHLAARSKNYELVVYYLADTAVRIQPNEDGYTTLHLALFIDAKPFSSAFYSETVNAQKTADALLRRKPKLAKVFSANVAKIPPLVLAANVSHDLFLLVLQYLVPKNDKFTKSNRKLLRTYSMCKGTGFHILHACARGENEETMLYLLEEGENGNRLGNIFGIGINEKEKAKGATALDYACVKKNSSLISKLTHFGGQRGIRMKGRKVKEQKKEAAYGLEISDEYAIAIKEGIRSERNRNFRKDI
eukprot:snap_masked-scaffold_19-processed-gene-4.7-mRNA-1 protein AED:0.45 eAED:0.49 QI:0/-1/0/1/-1/1/1/0/733